MTDLTVRPVNAFDEDGAAIEVTRRIMRRASAEQDRYINLERIANALSDSPNTKGVEHSLERIADALDRAFPFQESEPEEIKRNAAGMPIPSWAHGPSVVTEEIDPDCPPPWMRRQ